MTYEANRKLKGAILTQKNISELARSMKSFFGDVRITIKYNDNTTVSNIKVDEFEELSFKNKQLESMEMWDSTYDDDGRLSIWLKYDSYYDTYVLKYELSNKDIYIKTASLVDEWVTEVSDRKKYIDILHSPLIEFASFLIFFIPILLLVDKYSLSLLWVLVSIIASYAISLIFKYSVAYAFPITELDIGINGHKSFRKFIWGLIVIIIMPAIINIVF